jgi:hypothetical protein
MTNVHNDRRLAGQATIEIALLIPGLMLSLFLIAGVGLVARADGEVAGVAVEAARAGALVSSASEVQRAATTRAQAVGMSYGMTLHRLEVVVDSTDFRRGGEVRVRVRYELPLATLPLAGWGTVQLRHEAAEPVDLYRSLP